MPVLSRLAVCAVAAVLLGAGPAQRARPVDPSRLEVVENLSESLANDLLGLSVATRNRDLATVATFFPETLTAARLPTVPGAVTPELKWIGNRDWTAPEGDERERSRDEVLAEWTRLLEHFSEIEDARFKVKGAQFADSARAVEDAPEPTAAPGAEGTAQVAFFVLGRNQEGTREWLRARARVAVRKPESGVWQFTRFATTEMQSMVASEDLFSEIADPAGVGATLPPYGTPENGGFVWRGAAAGDIDGDGWIDLFVTSVRRNYLFLNAGDGRFRDATDDAGLGFLASGTAPLLLDFDNDGDMDVFVSTIQGPAHLLYRNNVGQEGRVVRLVLEGAEGRSRDAFGAVVRMSTSAGVLTKIKAGGSGFISQHDPRLLFGLSGDESVASVEVTWPGGEREVFAGPFPDGTTRRLRQGSGQAEPVTVQVARLPDPLTRAEVFARGLRIPLGGPLPDLPVRTMKGEATSLRAALVPGRSTIVNLWATWCGPCRLEMPELEALRSRLAAGGFDVVGLNVDGDPDADVAGYAASSGVSYPILVAGSEALEQIYVGDEVTVPLSFVVDGDGIVTELLPGWSDESRQRLEALADEHGTGATGAAGAP